MTKPTKHSPPSSQDRLNLLVVDIDALAKAINELKNCPLDDCYSLIRSCEVINVNLRPCWDEDEI